jgi:antitoxin component YwqK of YwqJK toxin-antitoxin module
MPRASCHDSAMAAKSTLPRLSRIAFYTSGEDQLVHALGNAIRQHLTDYPRAKLTGDQFAIYVWSRILIDVPNGGFTQFFFNHKGDVGLTALCELLTTVDEPEIAKLLNKADTVYRKHQKRFQVKNPWQGLFGSIKELEKLDSTFINADLGTPSGTLHQWMRDHIHDLAIGDDGKPLDPSFTGTVEGHHPNGKVCEQLAVKNGKAHGTYTEYFDDGTVRQATFYRSGAISGDFWPNGQIKKRASKKGPHKIIEFFYASGKLHKRMVKDKSGNHVDPIRRYHENGQLAEELTIVDDGTQPGDWLKFFEDGSPQLEGRRTRYAVDGLFVWNAWDDSRKQTVKDGNGLFDHDGCSIDCDRDIFWRSILNERHVIELQAGSPHGTCTTYRDGRISHVETFNKGERHGDSITYWDNGRVHLICHYKNGEGIGGDEKFPKFDNPVPVVSLTVEANEELYTAWRHVPVDQYPIPQNLDQIRAQLKIPQFLQDVYQRNLASKLNDNYEDWSDFKDGIAYFLTVDTSGRVTKAYAHASGVYSIGDWNTYVPLLMKLRFAPGSARGRPIECRVFAKVDHTFVESTTPGQKPRN